MNFKLILALVKPQKTDPVVDAAKSVGATGATILSGRGTGMREALTFFGLTLEDQTDVIMFLMGEHCVDNVLAAIEKAGEFEKPGTGIALVLPVDKAIGMESQIERFKEELQDNPL